MSFGLSNPTGISYSERVLFLFIHNLGLFLLRLVTGALVAIFAARELADRSDIILKTLKDLNLGSPDILQVFTGCAILFIGVLLFIGLWTRIMALALLLFLILGSYSWPAQDNHLFFQFQALYGALFLYLSLAGGGSWALSRPGGKDSESLLNAELSTPDLEDRPSILQELKEERIETTAENDATHSAKEANRNGEDRGKNPSPSA